MMRTAILMLGLVAWAARRVARDAPRRTWAVLRRASGWAVLGLVVAIPLTLIHSFLQGRVDTLITRLDEAAAELFAAGRAGVEKA